MKAEILNAWVTALRSGTYTQGSGLLRSGDNKYDALGVLCDVAAPGCWQRPNSYGPYRAGGYASRLSPTLCQRLRVPHALELRLALENDRGATFEQLAAIIEKHLNPQN